MQAKTPDQGNHDEPHQPRKKFRWHQVDLRTLLVLVLIAAILLGWYQYHRHEKEVMLRQNEAAKRMAALGGKPLSRMDKQDGSATDFPVVEAPPGAGKEFVSLLPMLRSVERISLHGSALTDQDLQYLLPVKGIRFLDLTAADITERGLSTLQRLELLEELILDHTPLTNEAVGRLSGMPSLESVSLRGTLVTKSGVEQLRAARPMLEVSWAVAPSSKHQQAAAELKRRPGQDIRLTTSPEGVRYSMAMDLRGPGSGIDSLSHIEWALPLIDDLEVVVLTIRGSGNLYLQKKQLELLGTCEHLRSLVIEKAVLMEQGIHLNKLRQIESLHLNECVISHVELAGVGELMGLRELVIDKPDYYLSGADYRVMHINDRGLEELSKLANLRILTLRNMAAAENLISRGAKAGQELSDLQITDDGLRHLLTLEELEELDLSGSPVTARGVLQLSELNSLRKLILIDIPLTDREKVELHAVLPKVDIAFEL